MPTAPKPPGQRVRRNKDQREWVTLDGTARKPPALPAKKPTWLKSTREWWKLLWASPMASVYLEADLDSLYRLARLKDREARGDLKDTALSSLQRLEDQFGLSPKARQNLQWQVKAQTGKAPRSKNDELAARREARRKAAAGE